MYSKVAMKCSSPIMPVVQSANKVRSSLPMGQNLIFYAVSTVVGKHARGLRVENDEFVMTGWCIPAEQRQLQITNRWLLLLGRWVKEVYTQTL